VPGDSKITYGKKRPGHEQGACKVKIVVSSVRHNDTFIEAPSADELELRAGFGRAGEAGALLDRRPLGGDKLKCVRAVACGAALNEPAADNHAGAADAAAAVDGCDAPACLGVGEHGKNGDHVRVRGREGAVVDREVVVLDLVG
jgi:hypothetical protein